LKNKLNNFYFKQAKDLPYWEDKESIRIVNCYKKQIQCKIK